MHNSLFSNSNKESEDAGLAGKSDWLLTIAAVLETREAREQLAPSGHMQKYPSVVRFALVSEHLYMCKVGFSEQKSEDFKQENNVQLVWMQTVAGIWQNFAFYCHFCNKKYTK